MAGNWSVPVHGVGSDGEGAAAVGAGPRGGPREAAEATAPPPRSPEPHFAPWTPEEDRVRWRGRWFRTFGGQSGGWEGNDTHWSSTPEPGLPRPGSDLSRPASAPDLLATRNSHEVDAAIKAVDSRLHGSRSLTLIERKKVYQDLLRTWHPDKAACRESLATPVFQHLQDQKGEFLK